MPVVISLLNAFTGLSAAAAGLALDNTALIVAGMIVGASGTILTRADGRGDEPLDPVDRRRRLRRRRGRRGRGGRRRARRHRALHERGRRRDPAGLRPQVVVVPGYGMAVAQAQHAVARAGQRAREARRRGQVRDPPGRRPHARPHERAAGRGRRALRPAQGDGRDQPASSARTDVAARDRRQRRHQPGGAHEPRLADLRHADPRRRRGAAR